ncbi:MAG: CheR family methyltransferase [Salinivenus sp.]
MSQASSSSSAPPDAPCGAPMPIVGIGASAGGVDALQTFFRHLPENLGAAPTTDEDDAPEGEEMAFVVVMHLSPDHESNLVDILQQETTLRVALAEDDTPVAGGTVYVIPPGCQLTIQEGRLQVQAAGARHDATSIDRFLRSLASDQRDNAVGIVLSGSGADGTLGLRAIKEAGGVTMVQSPEEAEYPSMPESALSTGLVDLSLPIGSLAETLVEYRDRAGVIQLPETEEDLEEDERSTLSSIFRELRHRSGIDFSSYKRSTVLRRLERRLQLWGVDSLEAYLPLLRDEHGEAQALRKDLLISVTSFFRDPEAFEALAETVLPALFEDKDPGDSVRVWVPGCATGEEAYSLAMLLTEYADTLDHPPRLQLFATDVDEDALGTAREGRYPKAIQSDISDERLQRFFQPDGDFYQVNHGLHDCVLFARHNVLEDPPFSNLDLISCRNLLIYLNQTLQEHVYKLIHYGLREDGFLFLGRSEALGQAGRLFTTTDAANNILQARPLPKNQSPHVPFMSVLRHTTRSADASDGSSPRTPFSPPDGPTPSGDTDDADRSVERLHQQAVMEDVASVLVDDTRKIVHLSGAADRYLQYEGGAPTSDLLSCVPKPVRPELRSALYQAFKKGERVRRTGLHLPLGGEQRRLALLVRPLESDGVQYAHVRFEDRAADPSAEPTAKAENEHEATLRAELERTREQLQNTSQEYEAATEEMETANEELLSMNEELQSKNEELETSKEELQSVNEELKATNRELKTKVEEARRSKGALENLMEATEIATLFLNRSLQIRRYTPAVTSLFNIQPSDVGRPLSDFAQRFDYEGLLDDAQQVLRSLESLEREVRDHNDRWYLAKIRPYRTVDDEVTGVVLTFVDITDRRRLERELVNATEKVRRQIGQDLHDILSSDLAALSMKLDNFKTKLERAGSEHVDTLDSIVGEARAAAEQARTLSHALVPVTLQEEHLAAALDTLCQEQGEVADLHFTFEGDREVALPRNKETAMQMYRIAHEAVVNARRHARADHVRIRLNHTDDALEMTVHDDGIGLRDDPDVAEGLGLRTMRYRANLIGASLSFDSNDEGGTTVRCRLPLAEADSE